MGGGVVPPIGLCNLAAQLQLESCKPLIIDLAAEFPDYDYSKSELPLEKIASFFQSLGQDTPVLIGIGPLVTANLRSTHDIIQICRNFTEAKIVIGGPLCSAPGISEVTTQYLDVDYYVSGDGEIPITAIWKSMSQGDSSAFRTQGIGLPSGSKPKPYREPNLDKLPLPARNLISNYDYQPSFRRSINSDRVTSAFLSRGCPYSCSFCAAPIVSGKIVRRLSPARISQEITSCGELGFNNIILYDDCLFIKSPSLEERVLEFTRSIERADWKGVFQLELRCDAVVSLSEKALNSLLDVGCRQINMGIEKAHIASLNSLRKKLTPEIAREACEIVDAIGIRAAGTFIIGGPGENKEDIEATIEFATSLPLDFAHFNPLAIYPGTALYTQEFGQYTSGHWLDLCLNSEIAPLGDILWRSVDISIENILESVSKGYKQFYSHDRLQRVIRKHTEVEKQTLVDYYDSLAHERAYSWSEKGQMVLKSPKKSEHQL